jgi:uncharacterized protein (DUF433 family)
VDWSEHITADPEVLSGKPTVRGTRLAVDFVLGLFAAGWSESQVLENYPGLTTDSLRAVFAFASDTLGDQSLYPRHRDVG